MWDSNSLKISHVRPAHLHNQTCLWYGKNLCEFDFLAQFTEFCEPKITSTFSFEHGKKLNLQKLKNMLKATWIFQASFFYYSTFYFFGSFIFLSPTQSPRGLPFLLSCFFAATWETEREKRVVGKKEKNVFGWGKIREREREIKSK